MNLNRIIPAEGRVEARFSWKSLAPGTVNKMGGTVENQLHKALLEGPGSTDRISLGTGQRASPALLVGQIGAFSALIAVGTILSNVILGFQLPAPLSEITLAPAFYLAIAVLYSRRVSFWATAIGSAVGEAVNIFFFGEAAAAFALTFIPGIIIARAPETLIVHRLREKARNWIIVGMVIATLYETLAFFFIDWPVYSFTTFYGCTSTGPCTTSGLTGGFWLAVFDFGTLIDLVWIPIAILLIYAARRSFNIKFFS